MTEVLRQIFSSLQIQGDSDDKGNESVEAASESEDDENVSDLEEQG